MSLLVQNKQTEPQYSAVGMGTNYTISSHSCKVGPVSWECNAINWTLAYMPSSKWVTLQKYWKRSTRKC